MSDPLEHEIRGALARRAATLSSEAVERVKAVDYGAAPTRRPGRIDRARTRLPGRLPLRTTIGAGATALAAGVAVAVALLSSGAPNAYAGWSPIPTTPTPAAVNAATAACKAMHAGFLGAEAVGRPPVLTDARGRYTAVVSVAGKIVSVCIFGGPHRGASVGGENVGFYAKPGPDQLGLYGGGGGSAPGFDGASGGERNLLGRAGRDITGVKFVFAGGATVNATVENGWYFAWWPTSLNARGAEPRPPLGPTSTPWRVAVTTSSGATRSSPFGIRCRPGRASCVFAGVKHR